jgi:hypothetical protein
LQVYSVYSGKLEGRAVADFLMAFLEGRLKVLSHESGFKGAPCQSPCDRQKCATHGLQAVQVVQVVGEKVMEEESVRVEEEVRVGEEVMEEEEENDEDDEDDVTGEVTLWGALCRTVKELMRREAVEAALSGCHALGGGGQRSELMRREAGEAGFRLQERERERESGGGCHALGGGGQRSDESAERARAHPQTPLLRAGSSESHLRTHSHPQNLLLLNSLCLNVTLNFPLSLTLSHTRKLLSFGQVQVHLFRKYRLSFHGRR